MCLPEYKKEKALTRARFELGLCIALFLAITAFFLSKREYTPRNRSNPKLEMMVNVVELPPRTTVSSQDPPPLLPMVPLAVEDEFVEPDATIELTEIDINIDLNPPEYSEDTQTATGNTRIITRKPPPVKENGYVKLALLVNHQGWVDSVVVIKNTTNDHDFELKSVKKAYRSRYLTEKARDNKTHWIERTFEFNK